MCAAKEKGAADVPRPFLLCPKYFCGDAMAGVALLHLGELLSSGVVVLEWASAPDGVRVSPDERREEPPKAGTMRGANPPRICRSPLDRSTLTDSNRLYATLPNRYSTTIQTQPQKAIRWIVRESSEAHRADAAAPRPWGRMCLGQLGKEIAKLLEMLP